MRLLLITAIVILPTLFTNPIVTLAAMKMRNTTAQIMPQAGIKIPIQLNPLGNFAASNMTFYINSTDKALHLKGTLKSMLHETISSSKMLVLAFEDRSTGNIVRPDIYKFINDTIAPGAIIHFDIGTTYSQKNANEFQFIKALFTY